MLGRILVGASATKVATTITASRGRLVREKLKYDLFTKALDRVLLVRKFWVAYKISLFCSQSDYYLPLKPEESSLQIFDAIVEAATYYLKEDIMNVIRTYLTHLKLVKYTISDDLQVIRFLLKTTLRSR